jgi:REP element-mobilizing transposase RayT
MEPSKTYHLYTHANGSENLFRSNENFRYFLKRYASFIPSVADTLAYCLMPNHLHLLVRIKSEQEIIKAYSQTSSQTSEVLLPRNINLGGLGEGLTPIEKRISKQFSNLFNSYTKSYNKMYSRMGSLFIPNFKRKEITSDSYFTRIIHYIHHNPVHHGFVKHLSDWTWSSYHDFLLPELTPAQQEVINWFGNREQFILFHKQALGTTPEITEHD